MAVFVIFMFVSAIVVAVALVVYIGSILYRVRHYWLPRWFKPAAVQQPAETTVQGGL